MAPGASVPAPASLSGVENSFQAAPGRTGISLPLSWYLQPRPHPRALPTPPLLEGHCPTSVPLSWRCGVASVTTVAPSKGRRGPALARRKGPTGPKPPHCSLRAPARIRPSCPRGGSSRSQRLAELPGFQPSSVSARSRLNRSMILGEASPADKTIPSILRNSQDFKPGAFPQSPPPRVVQEGDP